MRKIIVLPDGAGWAVKRQNFSTISTHHDQLDAICAGKEQAAIYSAKLYVYNEDCDLVDVCGFAHEIQPREGIAQLTA